jgi:lipopolysaccharide/colanic/teichoic acid biosynthesis glycosyltransferase
MSLPSPLYGALKRAMDIAGAGMGLSLLLLGLPVVGLAIKLGSRGPVFFAQERLTKGCRVFRFYKFRTMHIDRSLSAEERNRFNEMGGPHFKSRLDPRITRVGGILRKLSLDELPQFYNVLKGDMSLVGPRPPLTHEVANYAPWQKRRLSVRTGMTGLWQVSGRSHLDFYRMMELDIDYIDHPSILRDIAILIKTIPAVLFGKGAW